ncbi:MAG: tRNA (N6-threonylcarbamoyladenosine(37)-N6)-methyltransferase TrmO [Anaerolineales bacterium]|jgi:tRNA-Thr(GGU) m(6)t(6)A37 methyltransferase TsaA
MSIQLTPIGVIHTPFQTLEEMPIQPTSEASQPGVVEVFPQYAEGLQDLDGFSHIYLIYHLHRVQGVKLQVIPFLDTQPRGLFATRAPCRPNPIGLSLVRLERIEANRLYISRLDVLDQTPLLDIKPYIPAFEPSQDVRVGWVEQARDKVRSKRSDERFS